MTSQKGVFGLNKANGIIVALLVTSVFVVMVVASEIGPALALKDAEYSRGRISWNNDVTEFTMIMRIRNTQETVAQIPPATGFDVYLSNEYIGSGEIKNLKIPAQGSVPFPIKWDIPDSITASRLFEIGQGGEDLMIEMVMHEDIFGTPYDIPLTLEFGENEATVY